ncbi:helix-turn-helix domain-containing protein [Actinoplanes sp. NPDC049265]|uniref:helix-turn-helix domain-containing protein n=1 Tax=Actinoplanes sp. NPDC049265 TaxID=3363902 RepID=UPI003713776C
MPGNAARIQLGALLLRLKNRSGYSYAKLGKLVYVGKATIHRYCTGEAVPKHFGTVQDIGRVVGATRAEMAELSLWWSRAVTEEEAERNGAEAPPTEKPSAQTPPDDLTQEPAGPRRWSFRFRRRSFRFATAAVVLLVVLFVLNGPPPPEDPPTVVGPTWTLPPEPVPRQLFGVTVNSATGDMPTFDVGAVRLWDSGTLWARLQPSRGVFDWYLLDRHIAGTQAAGLPTLFTIGGTPGWAAPDAPKAPYPEDARAAPPDDLADWDAFIRALAQRYAGRIEAYELWALANDHRFYNGDTETLVEMSRRAKDIIDAADPSALVVCPGMGNLWTPEGRTRLQRFAELGGYKYCDVASIKLYQRSAAEPPETMFELTDTVDRILHVSGVHPRVWNTGTTYSIPLEGHLPEARARDYAVRFFLVGIMARNTFIERMYFYSWGKTTVPIVLQADGSPPTAAARGVEALQRWLAGAKSQVCGHGAALDLPPNAWECRFTRKDGSLPSSFTVAWTHQGRATIVAGPGVVAVDRLDGTSTPVRAGSRLELGEEPVLIRYA